MPIYAYRCASCGHAQDVLRKMSDPPLVECPACGAPTFVKQVTAAGFQLKGSGWYVTDFKGGGAAPKGDKPDAGEAGKGEAGRSDAAAPAEAGSGAAKAGDTPAAKADTAAASSTKAAKADSAAAPATPAASGGSK